MRFSALLGMALSALGMGRIGDRGPDVVLKSNPEPWLPPEVKARAKQKRSKVRVYQGGPTVKPPMNGKREITRRLRQIEAGTLTRANGLRTRAELGLPEVRA